MFLWSGSVVVIKVNSIAFIIAEYGMEPSQPRGSSNIIRFRGISHGVVVL